MVTTGGTATFTFDLVIQQTTGGEKDWFNYAEISHLENEDGEDRDLWDLDSVPDSNNSDENFVEPNELNDDNIESHDKGGEEDDHDPAGIEIYDLALRKTIANRFGPYEYGDLVTFTFDIFNQGSIEAKDIEISDYIPCGFKYDPSNDFNGWSYDSATGIATYTINPVLTPGSNTSVTIVLEVQQCIDNSIETFTNYAEISNSVSNDPDEPANDIDSTEDNINGNDPGGQPDSANDNEITEAPGQLPGDDDEDDHDPERIEVYDLAMIKELVTINDPFKYGQLLQFDITVCNQGNEDATEIVVTDYLPAGYSFSFGDNPLWGGTIAAPTFEIQGTLLQDQCTTFPIFLRIEQTTGGEKDWVNYSEITSSRDLDGQPRVDADSNNGSNNATENSVEPGHPEDGDNDLESVDKGGEEDDHDPAGIELLDLALRKDVANNFGPYEYGDVVTFTFEVFNQGSIQTSDIEITDYIPCGFKYLSTNDAAGWSYNAGTGNAVRVIAPVGLVPGQSMTFSIDLEVQQCIDSDTETFTNNAEISGFTSDDPDYPAPLDVDSMTDDIAGNDTGGRPDVAGEDDNVTGDKCAGEDEDDHDPERIEVYDLALIKELVTINDPYKYDQVLQFDITVCNQGNEDATQIVVTDYLPAGYSFSFAENPLWGGTTSVPTYTIPGTLVQDECVTFPILLRIEQTTGGEKDWVNYSEITSSRDLAGQPRVDADSNNGSNNATENSVEPDELGDDDIESVDKGGEEDDHDPAGIELLDLAVRKTLVSNGPFVYADIVEFEIEVFNQGSIEVTDIELTDHVPCGIIYMGTNDGLGWSLAGDVATLTLTTPLQPGNSTTVAFFGQLQECYDDEPNAWTNNVEISDEQSTDPDYPNPEDVDSQSDDTLGNDKGGNAEVAGEDDNITGDSCADEDEDDHDPELVPVYDLALQKRSTWMGIDSIGPFTLGDTIAFEIEVFNQGNIDAYQIEVTDYQNVGYLFDQSLNTAWTKTGDLIQTTIPGPLASGDSMTLILNLTIDVSGNSRQGDWYNEAEISQGRDENGVDRLDADSTPDTDPDNDNDLVDGPDDDPIFNGDDNDEVIDEHIDDPFNIGDDDEDDNDAEEVLVIGGIGDFVWKDLNGNGLQDPNEPGVENVVAILSDCNGNELDRTTTDPDGFYFFNALLPGDYQLTFDISDLPLGCDFTYQDVGDDDTIDSDVDLSGVAPCTNIEGGEFDSTFDVGLLILATIGDFVWEDMNGNGQQDFGEPGIEGVIVNLYNDAGLIEESTITDASGFYLFEYIYPGDYFLEFVTPDGFEITFANQGVNDAIDSDVTNINGEGTTQVTTLDPGEVDLDWDAGFYRCVPIGDLAWYDLNFNDMYDSNENGLNGLLVQLWRFHFGEWVLWEVTSTGSKPGTPSDDGYYKFCAPPGIYYTQIQLPPFGLVTAVANVGFNDEIDSDVTNANGPGTTDSFMVFSGDEKCDLGHGYYPMATMGDRAWRDDNSNGLQESNEPPIENVTVKAINATGDVIATATTGPNGVYKLDYLGKDGYYLKFTPPPGFGATNPDMGDDAMDSDIDHTYGYNTTKMYNLNPGQALSHVDAGFIFGVVVPVEWLSFEGENIGRANKLTWKTGSEINSEYFVIERRLESEDQFTAIGQVEASGTTNEVKDYRFDDLDLKGDGVYYYRLKQIDLDGQFEYSETISIYIEEERSSNDLTIYPNPAVDEFTLAVNLGEAVDVELSLWNTNAQSVDRILWQGQLATGEQEQIVDISHLASGAYTIRIVLGEEVVFKKLLIVNN